MKTIEKRRPMLYRSKLIEPEPARSHSLELARITSRYVIFRPAHDQQTSRHDDFDLFCGVFPEIVVRAKDHSVHLTMSGFTHIDGKSITIIEAQGTVGQLTDFADYNTRTLMGEYSYLLDYISNNLFISKDAWSYESHSKTILEFCPYKISSSKNEHNRTVLEKQMTQPWAEWDRGYCFRSQEDKVLAAMLVL